MSNFRKKLSLILNFFWNASALKSILDIFDPNRDEYNIVSKKGWKILNSENKDVYYE